MGQVLWEQSLNSRPNLTQAPKKKRAGFRRWALRIVIFILLAGGISTGIFGYKIISAGSQISDTDRSVFGQLKDLLFSQDKLLDGEEEDRINILLLAIGGEGHKGQNLADTIMVASLRPSDGQVALLSIPRDLYVQVPEADYYSKINAVHAYGESQDVGAGPDTLKRTVEDITGLPIHYYGRVDFTAFIQIIDAVGGVTIDIDNSFFDYWHKIAFHTGTEDMNGERALAYARARYVEGPEGGDFRRAERQQQILLALREKVFSVNTALDFTTLNSILNSLSDNIRTNLELQEMRRFYDMARLVDQSQVKSVVLTTGHTGVLQSDTEILGGTPASVLKTKTGDFSEVKAIAHNLFDSDHTLTTSASSSELAPTSEPAPEPEEEPVTEELNPTLEIRNGTNITGLAARTQDKLSDYTVLTIANAVTRDNTSTSVYVINEEAGDIATKIASALSADVKSGLPDTESKTQADLLIILGSDQDS